MTYEEYKNRLKKSEYFGLKCYIPGCNKPAEYEGGDARFYCGMCEEHAHIKERYEHDYKNINKNHPPKIFEVNYAEIKF